MPLTNRLARQASLARRLVCLCAISLGSLGLTNGRAQESPRVRLNDQTELVFVSVERGQELLGARDGFVKRLGLLELQLRLQTEQPVTQDDYLQALRDGVVAWKPAEIELVTSAVETLSQRMRDYRLPFPSEVFLIRTSSDKGENAPHCRGPSIILPDGFFANARSVPQVLAHELFHVLSSHNPELRDQLYGIIHFERTNEVTLPESLQPQRLTNPDAPANHHVLHVNLEGQSTPIVPVILTRSKEYRPGGIFANLDFKLMVLEEQDGRYQARLTDGQPELLPATAVPDYLQQIGRNTGYIIHPEETLADNFWMMVLGSERIQDPWVIDEMKKVLRK